MSASTSFLSLLALALNSSIVNAGVSIDEASVVAKNFIQSKNNHLINSFYIDEKNGIDNFYVFNLKPQGFIIVSAKK